MRISCDVYFVTKVERVRVLALASLLQSVAQNLCFILVLSAPRVSV